MAYIGRTPTNAALTAADLADGIVSTAKIATDAVTDAKIADDVVGTEHLTANEVDTAALKGDAVTGAELADNAVNSEHYTDGSIDNAHIADDAIDSEHYAAGSIDTAHIADNQITLAKLAGGTDGNIISYDASGDPVAIATGSDGQVLTSTGAGSPPAFEALPSASQDYVKLSSATPSAANTFSIDGHFTSDYDIYKIYAIGMSGASMNNTRISMRVNIGGTAQTGTNHYYHTFIAAGTSVNGNWSNSTGQGHSDIGYAHNSSGSTSQANFEFTIFRPLATDKTTILHDGIAADNGSDYGRYSGFTTWKVGAAISGITLGAGEFGSGNIEADRILVYGLKV